MYSICPKCKYKHRAADNGPTVCLACGIIFSKWMKQQFSASIIGNATQHQAKLNTLSLQSRISSSLFFIKDNTDPFTFYGRVAIFIGVACGSWHFISLVFVNNPSAITNSLMHNINLVFHEAGHIFSCHSVGL